MFKEFSKFISNKEKMAEKKEISVKETPLEEKLPELEQPENIEEEFTHRERNLFADRLLGSKGKRLAKIILITTALAIGSIQFYKKEVRERTPVAEVEGEKLSHKELIALAFEDPETVLKAAPQFINQLWAKEVIEIITRRIPRLALEYANNYSSLPDAEKFLRGAMEKYKERGYSILTFADKFRHLPDSQDILLKELKDNPDNALRFADKYRDYPDAENILREAMEKALIRQPQKILEFSEKYADIPWAQGFVIRAAEKTLEKEPSALIHYFPNYQKILPNPDELLNKAVNKILVEKYYRHMVRDLLDYSDHYKHLPNSEKILRQATELVLIKNPGAVFEFAGKLISYTWGAEIIIHSASKYPWLALRYFDRYQALPGAKNILRQSAEKTLEVEPSYVFGAVINFINEPWAEDIISKAAKRSPDDALYFYPNYKELPAASKILKQAAEVLILNNKSYSILSLADRFENQSWAYSLIETAARNHPDIAVEYFKKFSFLPKAKEILKRSAEAVLESKSSVLLANIDIFTKEKWAEGIIRKAAQANPSETLYFYKNIKLLPYGEKLILGAARQVIEKNPEEAVRYASTYVDYRGGEEILRQAVERTTDTHPSFIARQIDLLQSKSWAKKFIVASLCKDPVGFLSGINRMSVINFIKNNREDERLNSLYNLITTDIFLTEKEKENSWTAEELKMRMSILLVNEPNLPLDKAAATMRDENKAIELFLDLKSKPGVYGLHSIEEEIVSAALEQVYKINRLHEQPDSIRFRSVEKTGIQALYSLMVFGEEEIYTSSFNGLFNRLLGKMKEQKMSADGLFKTVKNERFRTFIKMASQFNRLNEFLKTTSPESKQSLLRQFVERIDQEKDMLKEAVAVADTFVNLEDASVLKALQVSIKSEYDRVVKEGNKSGETLYGLLAGMFGKKALVNEEWLQEMANKYKLPNLFEISSKKLFNPDGTNIQRHFFYNDEDGKSSFRSFLAQYRNSPDWSIEEKEQFVRIFSKSGNKVEIFANRPEKDFEGSNEIEKILKNRNIETIVIVHRGHSYHVNQTIDSIPKTAKIVFLGSCGGYQNIDRVLKQASEAHILTTKGTGTMLINDPLLKMLNEEIKSGNSVNWLQFWHKAEKHFGDNSDFRNYIAPHKNLGALFLKAYYSQTKTNK